MFAVGLLPSLSLDVEIHNPQSLAVAMSLARKLKLQDQCAPLDLVALRSSQRGLLLAPPKISALRAPTQPVAAQAPPTAIGPPAPEGRTIKQLS